MTAARALNWGDLASRCRSSIRCGQTPTGKHCIGLAKLADKLLLHIALSAAESHPNQHILPFDGLESAVYEGRRLIGRSCTRAGAESPRLLLSFTY